jgi:hypothetical protein
MRGDVARQENSGPEGRRDIPVIDAQVAHFDECGGLARKPC